MKYLLIASMLFGAFATTAQEVTWFDTKPDKHYTLKTSKSYVQVSKYSDKQALIYINGDTAEALQNLSKELIRLLEERSLIYARDKASNHMYCVECTRGAVPEEFYNEQIHHALGKWKEADYNLFEFHKKNQNK